MKKLFFIFLISVFSQFAFAAGDGGGSSSEVDLYKEAEQMVNRGRKLDEKGQTDKALKKIGRAHVWTPVTL